MLIAELKKVLEQRGQDTSGNKKVCIARLIALNDPSAVQEAISLSDAKRAADKAKKVSDAAAASSAGASSAGGV